MRPNLKFSVLLLALLAISACRKDPFRPYAVPAQSLQDFKNKNKPRSELHVVSEDNGAVFTTHKGTRVSIPANAFVDSNGNPVSGMIKVEFLDIYKKSDMLWTGITTQMNDGSPVKSGGEFFIRVKMLNDQALWLAPGMQIDVEQPLGNAQPDPDMVALVDADTANGWEFPDSAQGQVSCTAANYIYSLYQFANPSDSGTWCNSDNCAYFSAYPQTNFTVTATNNENLAPEVYLAFTGINSMVHVYPDWNNPGSHAYPYAFAPQGLPCTVVAIAEKNGQLYASFTPATIGSNQTVNVPLNLISEEELKKAIDALD